MSELLRVEEPARLLAFLRQRLPAWRKKTLEQRLRAGCVRVNGATVSRNEPLVAGDEVLVSARAEDGAALVAPQGISVLHADEDLIAIDKPAGLLSVATDSAQPSERTALARVRAALASSGREARLWPCHRLDRETSGVLLFARSRAARQAVLEAWPRARKLYLAIVEGRPAPPSGAIEQPLWEDEDLRVRVGARPGAKAARTRYASLQSRAQRTELEVELDSGRRHQIRAHLAWLGHPIVGDPRYGSAGPRLGLHALRLDVPHPADARVLTLTAPPPREFLALLAQRRD